MKTKPEQMTPTYLLNHNLENNKGLLITNKSPWNRMYFNFKVVEKIFVLDV